MKRNTKNNDNVVLIVKLDKEDETVYGAISIEGKKFITEFQGNYKAQSYSTWEGARNALTRHIEKRYKKHTISASGVMIDAL